MSFHAFINNEDVRRLFVYVRPPRQLIASLHPPYDLKAKSVFFLKNHVGVKLTKDNMGNRTSIYYYYFCSFSASYAQMCNNNTTAQHSGAYPVIFDILNSDTEVMYMDCGDNALLQLDMLTREIYLPLLCSDTVHASAHGISADKMMDLLHRLMSQVETVQGHTEVTSGSVSFIV